MSGLQYTLVLSLSLTSTAAFAESLLIKGMGRMVGWPVATADGSIRFRDCAGTLHALDDGRLTRTDRRCGRRHPFELAGIVVAIDPARSLLVIETAAGERRPLLVARPAAGVLEDLEIGGAVRVEGPVPGHASRVAAM